LGREEIKSIVEIQLQRLRQNLASRKMALEITDRAKALLADKGYDPVYGARPLKRTIQRLIQDPLAVKILEGEFTEGDRIKIDSVGDEMVFRHDGSVADNEGWEARTLSLSAVPKKNKNRRTPPGLARVRKELPPPGKIFKSKKKDNRQQLKEKLRRELQESVHLKRS
jgi:hypothetical protein